MQIQLLLEHKLKTSAMLQPLTKILYNNLQSCLNNINKQYNLLPNTNTKSINIQKTQDIAKYQKHCYRDVDDYQLYIKEYKQQFVSDVCEQRGEDICMQDILAVRNYDQMNINRNEPSIVNNVASINDKNMINNKNIASASVAAAVHDSSFNKKAQIRKKCVLFYMKGFNVFQQNVKDKLNSLINKLDYTQL